MQDILGLGRTAYHNHRNRAIDALAQELIRLLRPALHLESPAPLAAMLGREAELVAGRSALQECQTVNVLGPGGVGKTTFGVALARRVAPEATFWFTLQPGLSDRLHTVLFGLAHFLHSNGASSLWSQLIADRGEVKTETLSLLRSDLNELSDKDIVLCFDEVDLLRPAEVESHAEIVPFLHSLRELVPVLLIGQKAIIEADQHIELTGLPPFLAEQLLQQADVYLPRGETAQLCTVTAGNPRLLTLFVALYHSRQRAGEPIDKVMQQMTQTLSMEFLLRRLWPHLDQEEMFLLELLALFRHPLPRETWSATAELLALEQLISWQLVQVDQQGGVALLSAVKQAVQGLLSVDERTTLHLEAAQIRLTYGQYTWAAYHYAECDNHQMAFVLWEQHHEQEIDQGQAEAGLSLLQSISKQRLNEEDHDTLELRRIELQKLLGDYDEALRQIQQTFWRTPFLKVQGQRLAGHIHEMRGHRPQAIGAYENALDITEQWLRESAQLHRAVGYLYARERDFDAAQREVQRIRHDAANLEGVIFNWQGKDVTQIVQIYQEAIQFARAAEYPYGEYNTRINLGRIYGWQQELEKAEAHLRQAIDYFEMTGNLSKLASAKSNLAVAYCLSEQYEAAIEPAQDSLDLFEKLGEEFGRAAGAQILAEAHLGLGNLEQAEQFAQRVVQEENVHTQPDGLRVLGEVKFKQGSLPEAETFVTQSLKIAEETNNPKLQAYALRVLGKIYLAQKNVDQAYSVLDQAIQLFTDSGLAEEAEKTKYLRI